MTRPFTIRLKPHVKLRLQRHRRFEQEGRKPLFYANGTAIYKARKGDRKCAICESWFQRDRPWADAVDPVPVCFACRRHVPVTIANPGRGAGHQSLSRDEAAKYGGLFSSIRSAIWHLEREIERQN